MIYIEDILREIVELVSAELGQPVYYLHGSLREINARLAQLSQSEADRSKKFPLVCLLHDYTRTKGGAFEEARVTLLIATNTLANYLSDERLEKNFKGVLDPIYSELLRQLNRSPYFNTRSALLIPHVKIDHYFYGTEAGVSGHLSNRFNDLVDCIEMRDLQLVFIVNNCNNGSFKYSQLHQ